MSIRPSYIISGLTILLSIITTVRSGPNLTIIQVQKPPNRSSDITDNVNSLNSWTEAIKNFQEFANLNITSELDEETKKTILRPRCSERDKVFRTSNRRKRYVVQGSKHRNKNLTYTIKNYPKSMTTEDVDTEIQRAFSAWSEYTDLIFTRQDYGKPAFKISFENRYHDDGIPFDKEDGTLAHAFSPEDGSEIHFDALEDWSAGTSKGTNLYQVAVHEIGHALGLLHSETKHAVMAPFYYSYNPSFKLEKDDIDGIQAMYGKKSSTLKPQDNNLCADPNIDAILQSNDGHIYIFKGNKYYKLTDKSVEHGYPKLISGSWPGAPDDIDAAFEYKDGKIHFFKGSKYWRFTEGRIDKGFPKEINKVFSGVPDNLDAVLYSKDLDKMYFFKGRQIWEVYLRSGNIISMNINDIPGWELLPNHLDAAFTDSNGVTYFFKNNLVYEIRDNNTPSLREFHTKDTWFDCLKEKL